MPLYTIETLHPSTGWTDNPTLLGNGCSANNNRWLSEEEAIAACDELAQGLGVFRNALRVVSIESKSSVATVQEVLDSTAVSNGLHDFAADGGTVRVSTETLRAVLETYHNPEMPDWVALIDESDFDA